MTKSTYTALLKILRTEGPLSPASLMSRLGVSQSTLFRIAKAHGREIVTLGARRNRKLAALRTVRELGENIPIFSVSQVGQIKLIGRLLALFPTLFAFIEEVASTRPQYFSGLPFFLDDSKPQGFLGQSFVRNHPDLQLPPRILDWNNHDILEAMARRGEDLTGNLMIGAESFERYQFQGKDKTEIIDGAHTEKFYSKYAQIVLSGNYSGSSAGGEQPKFGAAISLGDGRVKKVLVKFSPAGDTFSAYRWRDLLICESLALQTLNEHGIPAAEARIIEADGRTFLETFRFDRVGSHGRIGIVSLSALENEWVGNTGNWSISAQVLVREKKISEKDFKTIQMLECFGRLIANTDRHPGNLSFFWQPGDKMARLAPVYDMLPMLYAPSSGGEDLKRIFRLPTYDYTLIDAWKKAYSIATQFWEKVREDSRITSEFKEIVGRNLKILAEHSCYNQS